MAEAGCLYADDALLPGGWARQVLLAWDGSGRLTEVSAGVAPPPGVRQAAGPVIPGLPNLHSHAFQRAMAGLVEHRAGPPGGEADSFWSWRELMYRFAARLGPRTLQAIATGLYVEMLEAGYTGVCEFHYVHHAPDGRPYADEATLALALLEAARAAGLRLTLLPVLYQAGGFGGQAPAAGQRRFLHSTASMSRLLERLRPACAASGAVLGLAPHSLRAVPPEALRESIAALHASDPSAPVHLHVAEQRREVDECVAWSGQRPVAWLLDQLPVDARWCLVHATHLDDDEARRAAACGAVAGLCPSTEANLGDGLFDLPRWRSAQGAFGIGSDSHVWVDAFGEVGLLELGQRLATGRRNVGATPAQPDTAAALWLAAVAGGSRASGRGAAGLAPGGDADFVALDAKSPGLQGLPAAAMLSTQVFARQPGAAAVAEVRVAGRCRVQDGRHPLREAASAGLRAARLALLDGPARALD